MRGHGRGRKLQWLYRLALAAISAVPGEERGEAETALLRAEAAKVQAEARLLEAERARLDAEARKARAEAEGTARRGALETEHLEIGLALKALALGSALAALLAGVILGVLDLGDLDLGGRQLLRDLVFPPR